MDRGGRGGEYIYSPVEREIMLPCKPASQSDLVGLRRSAWTSRAWAARGGVGIAQGT